MVTSFYTTFLHIYSIWSLIKKNSLNEQWNSIIEMVAAELKLHNVYNKWSFFESKAYLVNCAINNHVDTNLYLSQMVFWFANCRLSMAYSQQLAYFSMFILMRSYVIVSLHITQTNNNVIDPKKKKYMKSKGMITAKHNQRDEVQRKKKCSWKRVQSVRNAKPINNYLTR